MKPEWVLSIRDQCATAKVPFFFKQWGGVLKKAKGRELDKRTYDEMPGRSPHGIVPRAQRRELLGELVSRVAVSEYELNVDAPLRMAAT